MNLWGEALWGQCPHPVASNLEKVILGKPQNEHCGPQRMRAVDHWHLNLHDDCGQ